MTVSEILKELIDHLFKFDTEHQDTEDYTLQEFLGYLNAQSDMQTLRLRKISGDVMQWLEPAYMNTAKDISILLGLMYRYAKGYIKKVLKDSALRTADEFSFLITLMTYDSLTKSELISKQVVEKTSGTEVLRRLARQGFISEFSDPEDRRSVRVSITNTGKEAILSILPGMNDVTKIVVGNLTGEEINTLAYLLKKLDYFHNDLYMNRRHATVKELLSVHQRGQ